MCFCQHWATQSFYKSIWWLQLHLSIFSNGSMHSSTVMPQSLLFEFSWNWSNLQPLLKIIEILFLGPCNCICIFNNLQWSTNWFGLTMGRQWILSSSHASKDTSASNLHLRLLCHFIFNRKYLQYFSLMKWIYHLFS